MSRNTLWRRLRISELVDELSVGAALRLRTDSDSIRSTVKAVVDYMVEEYPGQDLYIPSSVTWPVEEIREAVRRGDSMREICKRFRVDRRTVYRLLDSSEST